MKWNYLTVLFAFSFLISACHSTKKLTSDTSICQPLQIVKTSSTSTLAFNIDTCYWAKPCLHVVVSYTGCKNDTFQLEWNGRMMKSLPPQLPMQVVATSASSCTLEPLKRNLCIDMDTLLHHPGINGKSIVNIEKWPQRIVIE